jgi:two-component sensor histidine kinase
VEDNPGDARLMAELLDEGCPGMVELVCVATLGEGLALVGSSRFGVILLDLGLPDSQGIATLQRMHTAAPATAIIVFTGRDDEELASLTLHAGAEDYLVKGQSDGTLVARSIRYAIERKRASRALRNAHDELEARVEARTVDLARANALLQEEIVERRKAEETATAALHEKEVLLKEIHHRVKNNLQVVASMLSLQIGMIDDKAVRAPLLESQNRVRTIALIHEKLYGSEDLARVRFRPYLEDLASFLGSGFREETGFVQVELDVEDVDLEVGTAIPVALVTTELVTNAFKHAFPARMEGRIRIGLHREGDGRMRLSVADDGVGLPETIDLLATGSLGLQIVSILAEQLGAELAVQRGSGTRFTLLFGTPT